MLTSIEFLNIVKEVLEEIKQEKPHWFDVIGWIKHMEQINTLEELVTVCEAHEKMAGLMKTFDHAGELMRGERNGKN